ncbi:MAG: sugar ABC transporter permease [Leptospiraceae bacterium]|nr:sugar ABC transporter permease [Leptospiraceae bacterium]MDW8305551.1 sugar ABC transporter permease [Leptospiraceae bacterium]
MNGKKYHVGFAVLGILLVYLAEGFLAHYAEKQKLIQEMVFAARGAATVLYEDNVFRQRGLASSSSVDKLQKVLQSFAREHTERRLVVLRDFNIVFSRDKAPNTAMVRDDYELKELYDRQIKVKRYFYTNERILRYKPDFVSEYRKKPMPEVDIEEKEGFLRLVYPLTMEGNFLGVAVLEGKSERLKLPSSFFYTYVLAIVVLLIFELLVERERGERALTDWTPVLRYSVGFVLLSAIFLLVAADRFTLQVMKELEILAQALKGKNLIREWWQISFNEHNLPLEVLTASGNIAANYSDKFFAKMAGFVAIFGLLLAILFIFGLRGFLTRRVQETWQKHRLAYLYIFPAVAATILIIFIPFAYSVGLSFFRNLYNHYYFAGLYNYFKILLDFAWQPRSFYYTLAVTVLWTFLNIILHVSIGLGLALILKEPALRFKGVYRALLILPWAVPNYITALIWKGMFHKEFGIINQTLKSLGFEPVSWFSSFWTALFANLATNTWLGFPFMMVIALGALQSIPRDLYEAADIDGATRWQKFRQITLPLLKPAMFPAIILGTIWTFNMFNVIYLVSNGAPNNSTDILVVEAYRAAFEKDLYAYASAYSMIIFFILLGYSYVTNRISRATEGVY